MGTVTGSAKTLEILDRLLAFDTVSSRSNRELIDYVDALLGAAGVETTLLEDASGTKANLYATIGPADRPGVMLSGHTDVVPVTGQAWSVPPFAMTVDAGRAYGRGSADMKGFDALAVWAMAEAAGRDLARPLQIALTRDEEIGCLAAPELIEAMSGLPRARLAIVGEPSMMKVVTGHKGGTGFHVTVTGHEVHSSRLPLEGVSAVHEAARLIAWSLDWNEASVAAGPNPLAVDFEPNVTQLHTGRIEGGTAHNISAGTCRFSIGAREVPGPRERDWEEAFRVECARVEAAMREMHPGCSIALERFFTVPPLRPEEEGAAEALARRITGDNGTHVVAYGAEAGQFQEAGYSAVICGPGDIAQAHQPDEFIDIAQLEEGTRFMRALLDDLET